MSERHFEQSMNSKEHIQSELEDSGISHPSEWRKALDLETPLEGEEGMESDHRSFEKLLAYLDGEKKISEKEKIEKFSQTQDSIERLEVLRSMSLGDAIASIRDYSATEGPYLYLANRLDFYQKFIQGKATRRQTESEWDSKKGEYIQVEKEYPIDASNASPETVRLGLLRDIEFAAMIGTPELGIYKVVDKRLKEKKISKTHMPELKGYYSGIHEGSIGYAYPVLRKLYEKARKHVEGRMGDKKAEEQVIEHRSVILASNWLEEAMNYNNPNRGPASPYVGSLDEAIAWGRLGPQVKKQLLGMRRKIQGVDLHNIERFVGKSGDDKYDPERKRLFGQIKFLKEGYDQEKKQEFTTKENGFAVQKQHKWHEKEIERLNHRLEKAKAEIEKANLPDEERELQLQSVLVRHQEAVTNVEQDYQNTVARLQERTPDQLLADLEQRQIVVNERHEKRKSLAQKALDLHFKINHAGRDYDSKPFAGIVDWINYAPLGTIKRGHKMMRLGMSDETITEYALADIIAGARGATREDIKVIHELVEKAKGQDWNARQKLEAMMKVGNILSVTGNEVSLDEVVDLAGKNFYGMTEALKMYDLEQVKQFIDQGINLQSITTTRTITQKHGHELSPIEVAEIASHNITGLDDSLRSFDLDQVRTLLNQDVNLPVAVAVLNNTRQFGYELSISQIVNVAKNVHDINDFTSALRGLPLSEVEKLFTVGVPYSEFGKVKSALEKHDHSSDFNSSLSVAQKLARNNEYDYLDNALQFYSLGEIDQIITKGSALSSVLEIRQPLEEKGIPTTLQETIQFAQYAGDWNKGYNLTQAIDTFGIDSVRKIVSKSCRLDKAIEVNNYINSDGSRSRYRSSESEISDSLRESLKKGGLDVVIAIAKAGNMEVAVKTIEAGFTVEEITRFPFLISPLVTKK
jgi:hypothetical protein